MQEHLTVQELLDSLKFCKGWLDRPGSIGCTGCPNAVPGSEDKNGFCECRFDTTDEVIYLLESMIKDQQQEVVVTVGKAETRVTKDQVLLKVQ